MSRTQHDDGCRKANARLVELNKIKTAIEAGYAGMMPNGNIVDRREHPTAMPIPKNSIFNTPEPRCPSCGDNLMERHGVKYCYTYDLT